MRRRARRRGADENGVGPGRDPLLATPVLATGVESKVDSESLVQIRREAAPRLGFAGFFVKVLRLRTNVRLDLDKRGTAYWQRIDGTRTLADIEKELRVQFSLSREECSRAVIEFTKQLMMRGMICLRLPGREAELSEEGAHG